jgi:small subunit ribosomal protein S17
VSLSEAKARGKRKARVGRVVSTAMDKTVVVEVRNEAAHSTYGKIVRRTKRLKAHDEGNEAGLGDTVRIAETRPLAKTKRWRVVDVVERAK